MSVDYTRRVAMPIRDLENDGEIVFQVIVYGWSAADVCVIPGGARPMRKAVERLGLDTNRYQAWIMDAPVERQSVPRTPRPRWE